MDPVNIVDKIFNFLSNKPVTVHQIVCGTRLHNKTVRKYLQLMEKIQNAPKIKKEILGVRVVFRKD